MKPQAVIDYNQGMKEVDVGDQMASYYPAVEQMVQESFYLFDLALTNAFLIYELVGGNTSRQLDFREDVRGLMEYVPDPPKYSGCGSNTALRLQGRTPHVLRENMGKKYKRCYVCYTHGKRTMTKAHHHVC